MSSGSLELLCDYGNSSGSEGEGGGVDEGRQRGSGAEGDPTVENLEVPEVIQGMYYLECWYPY